MTTPTTAASFASSRWPTRGPYARRARGDLSWQTEAACRGENLVLFFGPDGERQHERDTREHQAKKLCAQCPVRTACLEDALAMGDLDGVRGGLGADELVAERRHRRRTRRAA